MGTTPFPFAHDYSIAKGALQILVKNLSVVLAKQKVRINDISPGVVKTR